MSPGGTLRIVPRPQDGESTGAQSFRRLRELFDQLSDVDPEERGERLAALAVDEPDFAAELASLLDHADRSCSPLDSPAAVAVPEAPVEVPGYRVGRLVGRGGSSWVYLADQDLDGIERRVALKIIGGIEADRFLQRFEAEKRILAGLEHPGSPACTTPAGPGAASRSSPWSTVPTEILPPGLPVASRSLQKELDLDSLVRKLDLTGLRAI